MMTLIRLLKKISLCVSCTLFILGCSKLASLDSPVANRTVSPDSKVIVQLFNWTFAEVEQEIPTLSSIGYTHVQVSPPQLSINRTEWWARYQPVDYRVIDGPLGNEAQFKKMIDTAHRSNVKIVVDLVLNHMANFDYMTFNVPYRPDVAENLEYPSHDYRVKYGLPVLFSPEHFNPTGCIGDNWSNRRIVLTHRLCVSQDRGLPDLNLRHPYVLQMHREFLAKLKNLGVDGFRIDAIKHMDDLYINKLLEGLTDGMLVYGESIADQSNFKIHLEPYLRNTRIRYYDFPLITQLNSSFKGGDLGKLIDPVFREAALTDDRAVTFVVNHDLPNNGATFRHLMFNAAQEKMAMAFIFSRYDGIPYVYSERGDLSPPHKMMHRRKDIAAMVRFRKLTDRSSQNWKYASRERLVWSRGNNALAIINNANDTFRTSNIRVDVKDGEYYDLISAFENEGNSKIRIQVSNGKIVSGEVPAMKAALLVQ